MGIFKPKLWLGLTASSAALFTLVLAGNELATMNAGLINDALGLTAQKVDKIDSDLVEGSAYADEDGSLTTDGWKELIKDSYKFCEEAEEQGTVLLKNALVDGEPALPLKADETHVSLLGQGSRSLYMRSGAGGAAPNDGQNGTPNLVVKLDKAFEINGFEVNHTVFDKYTEMTQANMTTPDTKVEHSFSGFYTDEMKASFADYGDAAIVTFVRIGTEDTDPSIGTLDLNNDEIQLLQMIKQYKDNGTFKKVIVMINSPLPMSMNWVDNPDYGIDALLYMGVPGFYGVGGVVHVLMGKDAEGNIINPSGHLPDTFAMSAASSPAMVNFRDQNVTVYKEGIYVGYKYYETRYADCVMGEGNADGTKGVHMGEGNWEYSAEMGYPFGFGLSYTEFEQKINKVSYNQKTDQIDVEVEVKNVGDMDGKSSIQVYVSAPYTDFDKENGLGKSAIALMAYDKVDVKAGETVKKTVSFDRYFLCTYDNVVNQTYILEGGDYYFALGNGAHEAVNNVLGVLDSGYILVDHNGDDYTANTAAVKKLEIAENKNLYSVSHYNDTEVTNQFDDADYNWYAKENGGTPITYLDRQDWEGTYPTKTTTNPATSAQDNMSQYYNQDRDDDGGLSYTEGKGIDYDVPYEDGRIKFEEMSKVPLEGQVTDENSRFFGE